MLSPVGLMNSNRLCFLAANADLIAKGKKLIAAAVLIGIGICMDWGEPRLRNCRLPKLSIRSHFR